MNILRSQPKPSKYELEDLSVTNGSLYPKERNDVSYPQHYNHHQMDKEDEFIKKQKFSWRGLVRWKTWKESMMKYWCKVLP